MTLDGDVYSAHARVLRATIARLKAQTATLHQQVRPLTVEVRTRRAELGRAQHEWTAIAVGRVCAICYCSQASGEFDESVECRRA